ncbi:PIN domain nuclease [Nocardia otitidiscaviarum]|uniref:PIN domain nuclease n=1 Tax=Nocardia otitidiscaviarum TaxID=1823 RepID=UPI0018950904|nr:PIN domain nuclease [Nocardia otitidiscaviarum]MBF6235949.1 PIN domain nuclease [Nocardia otitidiscaviarum]
MTTRYLLDKSAGFRMHIAVVDARVGPLLERGLLATCGIADLEAGVSARSHEHHRALGEARRYALQYLTTPDDVWERTWQVQSQLCARSLHRSVKIPDLIIAAVAEHHGLTVLHYDHDFDRIAEITGQPVEWVVPPGMADQSMP